MPAIPVHARLEMHLTDEELCALTDVAHELVKTQAHSLDSLRADQATATARLNAACTLYAAAVRTMRERNLLA